MNNVAMIEDESIEKLITALEGALDLAKAIPKVRSETTVNALLAEMYDEIDIVLEAVAEIGSQCT